MNTFIELLLNNGLNTIVAKRHIVTIEPLKLENGQSRLKITLDVTDEKTNLNKTVFTDESYQSLKSRLNE